MHIDVRATSLQESVINVVLLAFIIRVMIPRLPSGVVPLLSKHPDGRLAIMCVRMCIMCPKYRCETFPSIGRYSNTVSFTVIQSVHSMEH